MSDHNQRRFNLEGLSPNNQYLNCNRFVNIPPPPLPPRFPPPNVLSAPLPPRFPPPNVLSAPLPTSFPPPHYSQYSPYPDHQMPPSISEGPMCPVPSWGGTHPASALVNQPPPSMEQFTQECSETDQEWVDRWTKNKNKARPVKCDIKINTVKEKLQTALKLLSELEHSSRTLCVMVKTVSSAEWEQKCNEVEEKKEQLVSLLSKLKLNEVELKCLKEKLSKREKKRARLRRQSERLKMQKEKEKVKIQNLHFQIDNWQKEMQEGVERVKREEEMKKEADAVLWGVTQKKTEAKRQVAMLSALLTLRSVRVTRLTAAGQLVSQSQIDAFNTVIERLKNLWSRHLQECQLEEQALRGLLGVSTHPIDATTDAVKTHKKLVINEWETAIFGSVGTLDSSSMAEEKISIRRDWDRFAVHDPSFLSSAVPPGYVLPVPPSSDAWRSFLKKY